MSIVLVIIGLIIGATFPLLRGMLQTQRSIASKKELETAKQALISFAITQGRLPKQDQGAGADVLGDGVEKDTTNCTNTNYCKLPYMTLQVKGTDNYSLPLLYDVTEVLRDPPESGNMCNTLYDLIPQVPPSGIPNVSCDGDNKPCVTNDSDTDNGAIQLYPDTGRNVAAIVISRGPNARLDGKNATGSNREYEMETKARTEDYDDVVVTLTYGELVSALNCGKKEGPPITLHLDATGVSFKCYTRCCGYNYTQLEDCLADPGECISGLEQFDGGVKTNKTSCN